MSSDSSSEFAGAGKSRPRPGPWPPKIEPFVAKRRDLNPNELKSWAKRTGFNPNVSGEASSVVGARDDRKEEIEPVVGRRAGSEVDLVARERGRATRVLPPGLGFRDVGGAEEETPLREKSEGLNGKGIGIGNGNGNGNVGVGAPRAPSVGGIVVGSEGSEKEEMKREEDVGIDVGFDDSETSENGLPSNKPQRIGVTENPGLPALVFCGIQHYLSLAGSLVFIPLVMVPVMGGTDEETAYVISTMLLVSGVTTIMHSYFGTRLPLVQGSSFVYLAPALVIINSEEFRNLSENKFRHTMRELQGAVIVGSLFQAILGYSGLMALLLRLINPVVVAPTVAAIGLAYFSYGFPQAGTCVEISLPLILLVLICTLYLRRISILGTRVFLIYAVPLSVAIVWAYAFFLTTGGAFNFKDCNLNIPSSNILSDSCRKHVSIMKHCRTDVSNAWKTAAWVRIPYPFQWGPPTFHFKTSLIMIFAALVASVDSVGSYHATSILLNLSPPTPGVVSRGIGLEGFTSVLAGLWGTGTGSTTLTENVHTLDATKMGCRKAIELGAVLLILFSFFGKIGAMLASIPLALAASVLCFTWALIVALGLATLQYTQTASSRNIIIVGFTLFISLSIPAYIQQYEPNSSLILPSYILPYGAASSGPVHTSGEGINFAFNALLSLNMVVAFLVAFVLDNTVPGSRQERGAYIWSDTRRPETNLSSLETYSLPKKVASCFRWARWVGS